MTAKDKVLFLEQTKLAREAQSKQELVDYATEVFSDWLEKAKEGQFRAIAVVVDRVDGVTEVGYPSSFEPAMIGAVAYLQKRLLEQ